MSGGRSDDAVIMICNDGNDFVTQRPRHLNLVSHNVEIEKPEGSVFQVPEGCKTIVINIGIGVIRAGGERSFLAAEITSSEFHGGNSPFPHVIDCGPMTE